MCCPIIRNRLDADDLWRMSFVIARASDVLDVGACLQLITLHARSNILRESDGARESHSEWRSSGAHKFPPSQRFSFMLTTQKVRHMSLQWETWIWKREERRTYAVEMLIIHVVIQSRTQSRSLHRSPSSCIPNEAKHWRLLKPRASCSFALFAGAVIAQSSPNIDAIIVTDNWLSQS